MAGQRVTEAERWFVAHAAEAPSPLRERALVYLRDAAATESSEEDALARAGLQALACAVAHPGDRSIALDLLAADALVTLALEARAESDPAGLEAFAVRLRQAAFAEKAT